MPWKVMAPAGGAWHRPDVHMPRILPCRPTYRLLTAVMLGATPALAGAQSVQDSARTAWPSPVPVVASDGVIFSRRDAAALAAFAIGTTVAYHNDRGIARAFRQPSVQDNGTLHTAAALFRSVGQPGVLVGGVGTYALGRALHRPRLAANGLHVTEAIVVAGLLTSAGKFAMGRARPSLSDGRTPDDFELWRGREPGYTSMPSGHTSAAFAAASALATEWRADAPASARVAVPLLYAGATLVGASRIYHNRHWASDVVAGAALGTLTGHVVARLARAHPRNAIDRRLLQWRMAPTLEGGRVGIMLTRWTTGSALPSEFPVDPDGRQHLEPH